MRKIFLLLFFLPIPSLLLSQQGEFKAYHKLKLGIAASGQAFIVWNVPEINNFIAKASPAYQISYDFVQKNDLSFGLAGTYQNFYFELYNNYASASVDFDKLSIGLRGSFLFIDNDKNSLYILGRFSLNIWQAFAKGEVDLNAFNLNYWWWPYIRIMMNPIIEDLYNGEENTISYGKSFSWFRFPFQLTLGYEYYFTRSLGLNLEASLGSPYIFMTGLTIKVPQK